MSGVYLPVACSAASSVSAGSRWKYSQSAQNSSSVGVPAVQSNNALIRGWVTPMASPSVLSDGRGLAASRCWDRMRMAALSSGVHSRALSAMKGILLMVRRFSNLMRGELDNVETYINIADMETNVTAMTTGQIAITMLNRLSVAKGITRELLAKTLNVTRQTITKRFHNRSMSLDDYLTTSAAIGIDPIQTLAKAAQIKNTALADEEAKSCEK